jgi:hypothetical protein
MFHGKQANKIFGANIRLAKVIAIFIVIDAACLCMESSDHVNDIVSKVSCVLFPKCSHYCIIDTSKLDVVWLY